MEARVLMELPDKWGECSRTIPLEGRPEAFAHWGDMIAVGVNSEVVFLDAITGTRTSVLSGNTSTILSLGFSHDGTLLVSHSLSGPVKLWDVQTGGVIRTFDYCTIGSAVSISPDGTTIALGTDSGTIHLWDVRTGKHHSIETGQDHSVNNIRFSPVDSRRLLLSSSPGVVQQWDVCGHQIGPSYKAGSQDLAYASDGTHFVSCGGEIATIRDSESGAVVAELQAPGPARTCRCCLSLDGRFVALSVDRIIYVWDITIPGAPRRFVGHLSGHSDDIDFIAFPSSLISVSRDKSLRFWPSSSFLAESKSTDHITVLQGLALVMSVNLFTRDGTVVTSDLSGVVKTWDLITGRCKSSFSTPAKGFRDTYLTGDALILVWWEDGEKRYHIWDVGKGQLLHRFPSSFHRVEDVEASGDVGKGLSEESCRPFHRLDDVKISGDGSKILGVYDKQVEVVSMQTGEITTRLEITVEWGGPLRLWVRGSQVGIDNWCRQGWDFGGRKVSDFGWLSNQFRLDLAGPSVGRSVTRWIVDTVTGRRVFHLPERHINPSMEVIWNGQYLLIWSLSGEVVVIDFDYVVQTLPTAFSGALSGFATLV